MRGFLHCLGAAIVSKGLKALIGQIPFVGVLCEVGEDVCVRWKERQEKARIQEELQQVAGASREQVEAAVAQVVKDVAADQPRPVQEALSAYLTQVPGSLRRSFRRPEDPSGTTVPGTFSLGGSKDLVPLLPSRLPRFKAGDQPLPGVPWQLTELLGVGGFGEVWKATHVRLKGIPPVALKFCLDPAAATSLRHEAALLDQVMMQKIDKGIVPLKNAYLEADPICLEYEYIEGGDLLGLMRRIQKLPVSKRIEVSQQTIRLLAETVGRMHRLSPPVIHRDLKPANVLARRRPDGAWQLLIADFGIGAVVAEKQVQAERQGTTSQGDLLATMAHGSCTPLYASPQQKAGERADPRDDIHALGVIWYQMLVGDPMRGIGTDYAEDLKDLGVGEATIRLLGSCVAGNLTRRPASAADLVGRISSLNPPPPPPLPPISPPPPVPPEVGRSEAGSAPISIPPTVPGTLTVQDPAAIHGPRKTKGLRKGQIKILQELAKAEGPLNRKTIGERIGNKSQMCDILGSVGSEHKDWGFPSLLDLGHVEKKRLDVDGKNEWVYEITASGKKALEELPKEPTAVPAPTTAPPKKGLRKPQIRCLKALASAKGPLNRAAIAENAGVNIAWVGDFVGSHNLDARKKSEDRHGFKSLITLGLARAKVVDVDGKSKDCYEITDAGREALAAAQQDETIPPADMVDSTTETYATQPVAGPGQQPERSGVVSYFRKVFHEHPELLTERSNKKLLKRWLADHPGETTVPKKVKANLANLKSVLRSRKRSKVAARAQKNLPPGQEAQKVATVPTGDTQLELLEHQIDECLILAKSMDRDALQSIISHLRQARNETVWKMGKQQPR